MDKIEKASTLWEILNGKTFTINPYQREYRWGKKQIEQLINDLTDAFLSYYDNDNYSHDSTEDVATYGYYYLGSIIRTSDNSTREIIDGQQRLTSLTLLLMYIFSELQKQGDADICINFSSMVYSSPYGGKKKFNIQEPDRLNCMENLQKGILDFTPENESSANLLERYKDIDELFRDEVRDDALPFFAIWVIQKVLLLEIITNSPQDAHTIFVTMNDRGLSLNSSEMLKAFIMNEIKTNVDEVNETWKEIVSKIKIASGKDSSGAVNTSDVEFISTWLRAKYANTIREGKKNSTDKDYELLGERFHEWVHQNKNQMGLRKRQDFIDFVNVEMKQMSNVYLKLKEYSEKFTPNFEHVFYNANRDLTYQVLLILSSIARYDSDEIIEKKIQLVSLFVDIFASNRMLNYKKANWNTNKVMLFKVLVNIRNKSVKEIGIILTKALEMSNVGWDKFTDLSYDNQFFKRYCLHFLSRFTDYINVQMGNPSEFKNYVDRKSKNPYDIEHVLPNKYIDYQNCFSDEKDFLQYRSNIGDLIILTKDKNRSYQDMLYPEKIEQYKKDNILAQCFDKDVCDHYPSLRPIVKKYNIKDYPVMDKDSIVDRAYCYLSIAKDIYDVQQIMDLVGGWTNEEYEEVSLETAKELSSYITNTWVLIANPKMYDIKGAFEESDCIEWNQVCNLKVDDIVYIYVTAPNKEISYKCLVEEINIPCNMRKINDSKFNKGLDTEVSKYARLKLLKKIPEGIVTLDKIRENGMVFSFQGPFRATNELINLIESSLDK